MSGDRCLLARQPGFRPGLWSVLAGFVEPGETLEEAVGREVAEEVGIQVDRIEYLGSQPWPFPMSLMIAFEAHARDDTLRLDTEELEAADWYSRDRVRQELAEGSLLLPSLKSISRWMIDDWLEDRSENPRTAQERLARSDLD
jgi:NAD+ diphosphatase